MKMQEKKLKKFSTYSKIANVFFIIVLVFSSLGLLVGLGVTTFLASTGYSITELINKFSVMALPNADLILPANVKISYGVIYLIIINTAAGAALTVYIIKSVANMFRYTAVDQTPFTEKTVKCVKSIGIAFLAYAAFVFVVSIIAGFAVPHMQEMSFNVTINGRSILLGLLLLSLGEIFEFGMSLQHDSESIV